MTLSQPKDSVSPPTVHHAFEFVRAQTIESLNLTVEHYRHRRTGAEHFHLAADNPENVFLVALRTAPMDSTGVAHILEHTVLCGSERFPVRDPFFMMTRRSLNTFMNAFTSSDWTAYPFASANKKDFNNLLDVYLDAVFFARLDELDFAQEGWRVEFTTPGDRASPLQFKGVVFNEMKGAMSSPVSSLWHRLAHYLFPTSTYHYNSGGDPEAIPDLAYGDLKAFYREHYHPSNAIFLTYGDIPVVEHHARMEDLALSRFEPLPKRVHVGPERRYLSPLSVEESYAFDEADATEKTHIVLGWLLGPSIELAELLRAHLLSGVLLDDSASPLRHALETTSLGSAPSPVSGLEDSNLEMSFLCGLEGSSPEHAQAVEDLVFSVLREVAEKGIAPERVEAVVHQLELSQREIGGDGHPYGLQLILDALAPAIHGGDPIAQLDLDGAIEALREEAKDPECIKRLVREWLLDNPHRVRLTFKPDQSLSARREAAEAARLASMKAALSADEAGRVVAEAEKLARRQQLHDDPDVLPKVGLADVPASLQIAQGQAETIGPYAATFYDQGTNGLVYEELAIDLPLLDSEAMAALPHYSGLLTELGCGNKDYLEMQAWQSAISGGLGAYTSIRASIADAQKPLGHFVLAGKALVRNQEGFHALMHETLEAVRFDETSRIKDLMAQRRARLERSVTGSGHVLAMAAATAGMSPAAAVRHQLQGLAGIQALRHLDARLEDPAELSGFAALLARMHEAVLAAPRQFLVVGEKKHHDLLRQGLASRWPGRGTSGTAFVPFGWPPVRRQVEQMWITGTQVNFCARAYPTVAVEHPDAASLAVLGGFMRNGYLHSAIREQGGAYGAGAGQDFDAGAFRLFSYRDPRLVDTLDHFDRAIDWLLNGTHEWRQVEEAILGVVSDMDKPGSPAGEAKKAFYNALYGRTAEQRRHFRSRILAVTLKDLQRVGETYLRSEAASTAVITSPATLEALGNLGLEVVRLEN